MRCSQSVRSHIRMYENRLKKAAVLLSICLLVKCEVSRSMYQVLYRKWRPKVFEDVVGQPQVTVTLRNELQAGRIAHAYLFTGSRGTGKTTCAKILAKAVNCLSLKDGDPCGICENCAGIDSGAIMDVVEIDAASNNGVENIRNLREESSFTPASAKYRVYIIDEVHMLSIGAFNALLKTLEEPPEHVVFILATTEVHKLPATILSRCQRFDFHRIAPEDISKRLQFVAGQEGAVVEEDAALLIARIADGALRDALSLLDQCIGRDRHVTATVVSETAGLAGKEHLFSLSQAVLSQESALALQIVDELHNASKDMARLCEELIGHFRNMMLLKTMKKPEELVLLPTDELKALKRQAEKIGLEEIIHVIDTLQASLEKMFSGANRRVEMEMCLLKMCTPALDDSQSAMMRRIAQLERDLRAGRFFEKKEEVLPLQRENLQEREPSKSIPFIDEPAEERKEKSQDPSQSINTAQNGSDEKTIKNRSAVSIDELQRNAQPMSCWPEVLQVLKGYSKVIASAFNDSVAYINGDYVLIDAPNQMAFELLRKSSQRDKMRVAIKEVTGRIYRLGPYQKMKNDEKENDSLDELYKLATENGINVTKK